LISTAAFTHTASSYVDEHNMPHKSNSDGNAMHSESGDDDGDDNDEPTRER